MEYLSLMRKLIQCIAPYVTFGQEKMLSQDQEEPAMTTVQLASAFMFTVWFHTKKSLLGNAIDWYEILSQHLRHSPAIRASFCTNLLFSQPSRFCEYLLECPIVEMRQAVSNLNAFCAHFASSDPPCPTLSCLPNIIVVDVSPQHWPVRPLAPGSPGSAIGGGVRVWSPFVTVLQHVRHLRQHGSA